MLRPVFRSTWPKRKATWGLRFGWPIDSANISDRRGFTTLRVLVLNALLYATWILVVFAGKDLLGQARGALSSDNIRHLVTFIPCVQAFGICLVPIRN